MKAKDRSKTPRKSSATSGWRLMPSMQRPDAMPCPTPEPMAANPIANPAPTALKAGTHWPSPSANAAVGAVNATALKAAVGICTGAGAARGADTKAHIRELPAIRATQVKTTERGAAMLMKFLFKLC